MRKVPQRWGTAFADDVLLLFVNFEGSTHWEVGGGVTPK